MKSVFLDNEHLSKLLDSEIGFEEHEMFKQNVNLYKEMWKDQGNEFWIKFVISCKEILGTHTGYHNNPHYVDVIYITFMKALLQDYFDEVTDFIKTTVLLKPEYTSVLPVVTKNGITELEKVTCPSDAMSKLVRTSFQLRVVGAFVRLLVPWQNSQPGNDFKWKFPNYWLIPGNENDNLELFIKSKWPVEKIIEMFGCQSNTIVWLATTDPNMSLSSSQVYLQALFSTITEQEREEIMKYPQTYLGWMRKPKTTRPALHVATDDHDIGIVETLEQVQEPFQHSGRMWHLVQVSLPPLLSRKYHIVNVAELMKDGAERNYMGVATWFVMWSQAFGLPLLNKIVNKHKELENLNKNEVVLYNKWKGTVFEARVLNWQNDVDLLLKQIRKVRCEISAPKPEDDATNALSFLLEPCIIIQLPWNTVLLHQWLAAALVEVLLFEKNSMEFHHWPFAQEVHECATSLITLVKRLKERVMLGFTIMFKQANSYPKVEVKHPGWILDEVVLPSLPVLQFLITGKAYTVLKNLKKLAWSKPESTVCMASTAYQMDISMTAIFSEFCYTSFCFEAFDPQVYPPFPIHDCTFRASDNGDLNKVIPRLKVKEEVKTEESNLIKFWSHFEIYLHQIFKYNAESPLKEHSKQHIEKALTIIKTHVIDPGRLPGLTMEMVKQKFDSEEIRKSIAAMWDKDDMYKPEQFAIMYALIYDACYVRLIGSEKEVNVMSKLINLGIEVLEREQIIRLTHALGIIFKIIPIAIKLDQQPPSSIESLSTLIKDCDQKCTSQTRDWLWRQFPAEWKNPVSVFMSKEVGDMLQRGVQAEARDFVKSLEERIGCIVFSLAQTCFSVFERGGEVFQDWQTVQYILPCFVAAYVETINNSESSKLRQKLLEMYKLVDTLIMYYEEKYLTWAIHLFPRTTPDLSMQVASPVNKAYCREIAVLILYYKEIIETILKVHVNSDTGIIGFDKIKSALLGWPIDREMTSQILNEQSLFALRTWLNSTFLFLKDLYQSCLNAYRIPLPGCGISDKKLGDMYLVDGVMHVLETVFWMSNNYISRQQMEQPVVNAIFDKSGIKRGLNQWRCDLLRAVLTKCKNPTDTTPFFIESERTIKIEVYQLFKKYRESTGALQLQLVENFPDKPPVLKLAIKYFLEADFDNLDKILSIIVPPAECESSTSKEVEAPKVLQKCMNCLKKERECGTFLVCNKCVEQKYPQVHFFCSKECKKKRWLDQHQAEHIEFELSNL